VAVEALDERAAVGVTELVRDHVWRQPTLHEERRAGVAQLVELGLVAAGPALMHRAEGAGERAFGETLAAARVERVRAVDAWRHVGERFERGRRHGDDASARISASAIVPARRASRIDVLNALQYE
jgi:hypothetical protein